MSYPRSTPQWQRLLIAVKQCARESFPNLHLSPQDPHVIAARSPDRGIGRTEDRHRGRADGGGEMGDAAVVTDVETRPREEAGEVVQVVEADASGSGGAASPGHPRAGKGRVAAQPRDFFSGP